MTTHRPPAPSVIERAWNPFAPSTPPRTPLDDIPEHDRLPDGHPLVALVDRALTPTGLTDGTWDALKAKPLPHYGTAISRARREYNDHRRDQAAQGLSPDPTAVDHIRATALAELARRTPPRQRSPHSELAQVIDHIARRPPRPATGAGTFRRAFQSAMKGTRR